jgi:hypothetical protein
MKLLIQFLYEGKTQTEINQAIRKLRDDIKKMKDKMNNEEDISKKRIIAKKIQIAELKIDVLQYEEPS